LYCGKDIGAFRLLRDSEFCSIVHRKKYGERLGKALHNIAEPEPAPKKKGSKDAQTGAWSLASGEAAGEEADEAPKKPSVVITTWADYKKAGPLLISTDHRGTADEKPVRISFSDVSVKVVGSENWIKAQ